VFRWYFHS